MSRSRLPVAAIQPRAHDRAGFDRAWPRVAELAREAAERGAKLIVLPEATVPGYVLGTEPVQEEQLARAREDLRATAVRSGAVIVYGTAKLDRGRVYNAAVCIGPDGAEIGYAAKQFLWHFDRRWFAPGDRLQPLATPFGTLGILVCADGRIPTIAATLVERGAQILVMSTAWVTSGRDPAALENVQADLMAGVRARENGVPFVVANKCGVELESVAYCGKSAILDARGEFVARGSERGEEIVYGEVELAAVAPQPREVFAVPAGAAPRARGDARRERARVAFTTAREARDLERFATQAAFADCDVMFARDVADARTHPPLARANAADAGTLGTCDGLTYALVDDATMQNPRGLVEARLAEIDFVVWRAAAGGDSAWRTRFARTRAAELRAYVLVLDAEGERAFAVDPDGAVIAGTFDDYRLASFAYDRARTRATTVAPTTDVLEGLRIAEAIRERQPSGVR